MLGACDFSCKTAANLFQCKCIFSFMCSGIYVRKNLFFFFFSQTLSFYILKFVDRNDNPLTLNFSQFTQIDRSQTWSRANQRFFTFNFDECFRFFLWNFEYIMLMLVNSFSNSSALYYLNSFYVHAAAFVYKLHDFMLIWTHFKILRCKTTQKFVWS